tara:strand:- start:266 stop:724 length:459 start_codon:yes stop_codon:yes gene_type:complete
MPIEINIPKMVAEQEKHIVDFETLLEKIQFNTFVARYHLNDEVWEEDYLGLIKKGDLRQKEINVQMKHSQYSVRYFNALREMEIPKMKVITNLIKSNSMDMEHYLSECVAEDLLSEDWYKNRVDKLMNEIQSFEALNQMLESGHHSITRVYT